MDRQDGGGPRERWLILAALFLARTAMGYQFQSIAALSPFFAPRLGIDYAELGLLIGVYLLPGAAIAYAGGLLGQRFGDKRIVLAGLALMALGGALTVGDASYARLLAGRIVGGTGAVLLNVLMIKMTTDWFIGREISTALAILGSSWPFGIAVALVTLPWFAAAWSASAAFATTALSSALLLVLVAGVYRSPPAAPAVASAAPRFGLSAREFRLASLAGCVWMLFNLGVIIVVSFAPALLVGRGMSAGEAGFATSLLAWAAIATIAPGGMIVDRIGHARAITSVGVAVLGLLIMAVPAAPSLMTLAAIGVAGGLPGGPLLALPSTVLRAQSRGPGMGVFLTWYYVGMAVLTPVAGLARDLTGRPGAPLIFAGALELLAVAVLGLFFVLAARHPGQS